MDQVILWACLCFLIYLFLFSLTESFYCSHFVIEFIVESWVTYSTYLCKQRIWLLSPLRKSVSNRRNQGLCGNAIPTIFAVIFIFLILCHQLSPRSSLSPWTLGRPGSFFCILLLDFSHCGVGKQSKHWFTDRKVEAWD